jgi:hypothetical protein
VDVDLWPTDSARLILFGEGWSRTDMVDCPATIVVDGRWLTLRGGETHRVESETGEWRHATEADVNMLPPL